MKSTGFIVSDANQKQEETEFSNMRGVNMYVYILQCVCLTSPKNNNEFVFVPKESGHTRIETLSVFCAFNQFLEPSAMRLSITFSW